LLTNTALLILGKNISRASLHQ